MDSCLALASAPESLLLLITTTGTALSAPDLQASTIACILLPLCDARKPRFISLPYAPSCRAAAFVCSRRSCQRFIHTKSQGTLSNTEEKLYPFHGNLSITPHTRERCLTEAWGRLAPAFGDSAGILTKLYQADRYDFMGNHRCSGKIRPLGTFIRRCTR